MSAAFASTILLYLFYKIIMLKKLNLNFVLCLKMSPLLSHQVPVTLPKAPVEEAEVVEVKT